MELLRKRDNPEYKVTLHLFIGQKFALTMEYLDHLLEVGSE